LHGLGRVHPEASQRARFTKGLAAFKALESPNHTVAVFEAPKPFGFSVAAYTRQTCLSVAGGLEVTVYRKIQQLGAANASGCGLLVLLAPAGLCLFMRELYHKARTSAVQVQHTWNQALVE
jgi:hypothetical protein